MEERENNKRKRNLSNNERSERKQELLEALLQECAMGGDLFGPECVFTKLKRDVMVRLLEAEMATHLGRDPREREACGNYRNGHSRKTVVTQSGPVAISVAWYRTGTFGPELVKTNQRRLEGFDQKALALYSRGSELRRRGVRDILFLCADGLKGLDKAIESSFPCAVHQTCVVHLVRALLRFVAWDDRKAAATARKRSLNSQLRKSIRNRGPLPNQDAAKEAPLHGDQEREEELEDQLGLDPGSCPTGHHVWRTTTWLPVNLQRNSDTHSPPSTRG